VVPAAAVRATSGDEAEVVVCGSDGRAHVVRIRRGPDGEAAAAGWVEARPAATPPPARPAGARGEDGAGVAVSVISPGTPVAVDPVLGLAEGDPIEPAR
jgi:hypothetical protein